MFFTQKIFYIFDYNIHIYDFLLFAWIVGAIFYTIRLLHKYYNFIFYISGLPDNVRLSNNVKQLLVPELIGENNYNKCKIHRCSFASSPFITGLSKPIIILPDIDFTDIELRYIFLHELQHFKYHDIFLKLNMEIIASLFWWNPFIHLLKRQISNLLELRVDTAISKNWNEKQKTEYLQCLTNIYRQSFNQKHPQLAMDFSNQNSNFILKRADSLFYHKRSLLHSVLFIIISLFLVFSSFSFVFEPYIIIPEVVQDSFSITDNSYILLDDDGAYYLFVDDQKMGTLNNSNIESFRNLKIFNKKMEEIQK